MFRLLMDAHSKWGELMDMAKSTTAMSTVAALGHLFAAYGLPEQVVSDIVHSSPLKSSQSFCKPMG